MDHNDPPPPGDERRAAPRTERHEPLFARVAACPEHPDLVGTVLRAASEDLSRGGLRVRMDRELEAGTVFELWVKIQDAEGTFLLRGTVRWCQAAEPEGDWLAGVQLMASDDPRGDDLDPWDTTLGQVEGS